MIFAGGPLDGEQVGSLDRGSINIWCSVIDDSGYFEYRQGHYDESWAWQGWVEL